MTLEKLFYTLLCWMLLCSPANANQTIEALEQRLTSGEQLSLNAEEMIEVIQGYDKCSADLRNHIWKQLPLSNTIPTLSIERWLNPMGPRHSPPTVIRIDAIRMLSIRKDPRALAALWTIYARSRLDILPEDPDLFERALDVIIAIAEDNPEQTSLFFENHAGNTLVDAVSTALSKEAAEQLRRWKKNTEALESIAPINHQLSAQWKSDGSSWLRQTQSDEGSLGIELLRLTLLQISSVEHDEPLQTELQALAGKHNVSNPLPSIVRSLDKPGQLGTLETPQPIQGGSA